LPGENIALQKFAEQHPGTFGSAVASLAVNGNVTVNNDGYTCAHTTNGTPAYWEVELGAPYKISGIKIYNRDRARK